MRQPSRAYLSWREKKTSSGFKRNRVGGKKVLLGCVAGNRLPRGLVAWRGVRQHMPHWLSVVQRSDIAGRVGERREGNEKTASGAVRCVALLAVCCAAELQVLEETPPKESGT